MELTPIQKDALTELLNIGFGRAAASLSQLTGHRELETPGGGTMFGVLVVAAPDGRVGYLSAFSGMLGGRWQVEGFAPPLFDLSAFEKFWPAGEEELRILERDRYGGVSTGQFLIAADGIIRWCRVQGVTDQPATLGNFPSEAELLAAVQSFAR